MKLRDRSDYSTITVLFCTITWNASTGINTIYYNRYCSIHFYLCLIFWETPESPISESKKFKLMPFIIMILYLLFHALFSNHPIETLYYYLVPYNKAWIWEYNAVPACSIAIDAAIVVWNQFFVTIMPQHLNKTKISANTDKMRLSIIQESNCINGNCS